MIGLARTAAVAGFAMASFAMACVGLARVAPASAQSPTSALIGSWSGNGRITYTDGSTEGIRCTAYYSGGGTELGMAIQCNSDKNPIHIRSKLRISSGRASGEWEERTFNASGSASGTATASNIALSINGGGFSGSMAVAYGGSSHTVSITTQGIAMSRASISFSRR